MCSNMWQGRCSRICKKTVTAAYVGMHVDCLYVTIGLNTLVASNGQLFATHLRFTTSTASTFPQLVLRFSFACRSLRFLCKLKLANRAHFLLECVIRRSLILLACLFYCALAAAASLAGLQFQRCSAWPLTWRCTRRQYSYVATAVDVGCSTVSSTI